jgi:SAM-dependent methyltransferase
MALPPTSQTDPPRDQHHYWDRVADEKTFTHPLDAEYLQRVLPASATILDLGCGYGRVCQQLHGLGYTNAIGLDTSPGMVAIGRKHHPELDLRHLATPELPFPDASVDGVLLVAVLTCIPGDEDQRRLVAEILRVLKPGGWLHVSDYFLQPDARNQARYRENQARFGRTGVFAHPDGVVLRHHEPAWIEELLSPLRQRALRTLAVPTMNGNKSIIFQYWGQRR